MNTVDRAAQRSLQALDSTEVLLEGVTLGKHVSSEVGRRSYLHAGPPIDAPEVSGPLRGALIAALLFEGEADTAEQGADLLRRGALRLVPCHDVGVVGAAAGVVSPHTPAVVVAGPDGERCFSPLNEATTRAMRFGCFDEKTLHQLRWMSSIAAPVLDHAIRHSSLEVTSIIAESLRRGDEGHGRTVAGRDLLLGQLVDGLLHSPAPTGEVTAVVRWARDNRHLFNSFAIATAKVLAEAAARIADSPVVTAIASNGVELGIRTAHGGQRWFTAPAPYGHPVLFQPFKSGDAAPVIGDSFIAEVAGFGAAAITAAPAAGSYFGIDPAAAARIGARIRSVSIGESTRFMVPAQGFTGTPCGLDVRLVSEGRTPVVNNAVLHRESGGGQVGGGITELPAAPFEAAAHALGRASRIDSLAPLGAAVQEQLPQEVGTP